MLVLSLCSGIMTNHNHGGIALLESLAADSTYLIRILLSAVCGALIGLERERRFKNAGIRTHIIVSMSSALMMIVSKYGFFDVLMYDSISVDASRIAAGVVTAIGFLGGGVIYIKKENTIGLTTAAGLWATVGIGIALGAGMIYIGIATTLLILFFQTLLHVMRFRVLTQASAAITVNLTTSGLSVDDIAQFCKSQKMSQRGIRLTKDSDGNIIYNSYVVFPRKMDIHRILDVIKDSPILNAIDISMSVHV